MSVPTTSRPLRAGAALGAVAQVAAAGGAALTGIVVARELGPSGTGAYAVAVTLLTLLVTACALGLDSGVTYYVAGGRWAPAAAWRAVQRFALVAGVVGVALGLALRLIFPAAFRGLPVGYVLIAVGALPFALAWVLLACVAVARSLYETYAAPSVVQAILLILLSGGGALIGGLRGALIGLALSHVGAWAVVAVLSWRGVGGVAGASSVGVREGLRFGSRTYLAGLLQFLNFRLDLLILNGFASAAAVGRYSVAVWVTQVLWLLPRALSGVVFPRVAALGGSEDVEVRSVRHVVLLTGVAAVLLAVALVLLVELVYGTAFRGAIGLGLILLPGVALLGIGNVLFATVLGRGRPELNLRAALVATPVTVVLYVALIPWLDAVGAALASSLSYALSFGLAVRAYRVATGRSAWPALRPGRAELRDYAGGWRR